MKINHPAPEPGRVEFLGIEFQDGTAIVDDVHPERVAALIQHGATVVAEGTRLEDLTKAVLLDIAETEGIDLPAKATKAQIIDAINAAPVPVLTEVPEA
ncbi:hypothetical protein [Microbacterium sp. GXS0129]|uniref:hypothetical protein n=1 Tax=Microbacterium sp. GXS0129 TaxID=3377836 RepID=UPI00383A9CE7